MNRKKIKKLILVLLIILIFMIIILKYISNKNDQSDLIFAEEEYEEDEEYPYNAYKLLMKYNGECSKKEIAKSFARFSKKKLPEYYKNLKNMSDDEIEKYFDDNFEEIYSVAGIEYSEDFNEIIKKLRLLNQDELKFESFRIDDENISEEIDGVSGILYITYENASELGFNIKIYNNIQDYDNFVMYSIIDQ